MQAQATVKAATAPSLSLSRPVSFWKVIGVTTLKDLQVAKRYAPDLIGRLVELGIRVLFFFLLSTVLTVRGSQAIGRELSGHDLFIFFQGALVLFVFKGIALWTPLGAVHNDLYNGTLEFLYSNPVSRYAYYIGTVLGAAIIALPVFFPLYILLIVSSQASIANMLMVLLACLVTLISLMALGIMISLLGLLWRQVQSIAQILDISFELIAGAYFPLMGFPQIIQYIAYVLPFTWGYDLIRYYSFQGNWKTVFPVWQEWLLLLVYALGYTLLSRFLLAKVEQRAKRNGLHLI